jgi:dihydrofolate reductase
MKTILYMAISADGFIAGANDETPWSEEEWAAFQEFVKSCDIVLLGRRTYEIMSKQGEFVDGPDYFVVTSDASADTGNFRKLTPVRHKPN